ncbi:MAG: TadE/TadG family type IV pilus assembly protein [Anaerolineales bacterium]
MKKKNPQNKRLEQAQSLVELAISLTFIFLLLSGAITFGMAYFSYLSLNDAAQEGALYGSLKPDDQVGICNRVKGMSTSPVDFSQLACGGSQLPPQITITYSGSAGLDGGMCQGTTSGNTNTITVTVSYTYKIFMPFISAAIGGNTIPLQGTATDSILMPQCQ